MTITTVLLIIIVLILLWRFGSIAARIAAWVYLTSGLLSLFAHGLTAAGLRDLTIAAFLWTLGHILYARDHGHYKSRLIDRADTGLRHVLRLPARPDHETHPRTKTRRTAGIGATLLAMRFPYASTIIRAFHRR